MAHDIVDGALDEGVLLGSEAELLTRYGVSRAIFREALRLLEYHSMVIGRRGPGGGIYVGSPNPFAVTSATALYLESARVEHTDVHTMRIVLESYAVRQATSTLDDSAIERLRESVESELRTTAPRKYVLDNDFHQIICDLAGNQALALFVDV